MSDARPVTIHLQPAELLMAGHAGLMRAVENIKFARQPRYGASNGHRFGLHVVGAIGEYVAAKALGLTWTGKGIFRGADLGTDIQVRTRTGPAAERQLILHDDDADAAPFVLVVGDNNQDWQVMGWCWGHEGKHPDYWQDPAGGRPAYFVPTERLRAVAELRDLRDE